uniref:HGTP_anticodon domain-containing protein n=1 Tax=Panagrellus redivivus TaxID=6233 RepID=A0A7E4VV52_PANRE
MTAESQIDKKNEVPKVVEYRLLFLGSHHKASLFDKLCSAVDRFERHPQYKDIWYLETVVDDVPCMIELNDPGMAHTGAREMSIRKADAAILCYSCLSVGSFHELSSIADDFKAGKKNGKSKATQSRPKPIKLICNEDEVVEDDLDGDQCSSEGYESGEDMSKLRRRRRSMEKIVEAHDNERITDEQGEDMAKLFGPDCEFISISVSKFTTVGARTLIEDLIRSVNYLNPNKLKPLQKGRRSKSKDPKRRESMSNHNSVTSSSSSSDGFSTTTIVEPYDAPSVPNLPSNPPSPTKVKDKFKKRAHAVSSVCTIS